MNTITPGLSTPMWTRVSVAFALIISALASGVAEAQLVPESRY
ncbi:MAG: hypothetical protein AAF138_08055 [Planctomycetota bacterium]